MLYSLDTNALIDAWNEWYSTYSHPTFWVKLEELARQGKLKISDTVLWELEEIEGDALTEWCKDREGFLCYPSDQAIQSAVGDLLNRYRNFGSTGLGAKNYADPFVVALAKQNSGCHVVTHERATGNMNGPRIPDICRSEGIPIIRLPRLVQMEGWVFT